MNAPSWLNTAIFYEIYPQSFYDANGDGIGDFQGIAEKLDYIRELGCNALWINPCFDSPFKDAGYDVRDYKKVAPRYGTNEDLYALFEKAHEKGIRVLLDLVPGHTSEEHEWFLKSAQAQPNEYSGRYHWTSFWLSRTAGYPCVCGEAERDGAYLLNFFKCQPALNYGWLNPTEEWQKGMEDPDSIATKEALKDIMRFWLDHGCDGFRVDMADSLVKGDDEKKTGTSSIWREVRAMLDADYPEAVMISEWGHPELALRAGFHADFYLDHQGNGYNTLLRDYETEGGDHSYFKKDAGGDITRFLTDYMARYEATKDDGYISFITCNHDTPRASRTLTDRERMVAYAMLFTLPGVPFLYYGDEIGMRYLNLRTKEGGYSRTGTRTPMQWTQEENKGFSKAPMNALYLPVDPAEDAPSVQAQEGKAGSMLEVVRSILKLRAEQTRLQADGSFTPVIAEAGRPFAYLRENLLCIVNPDGEAKTISAADLSGKLLGLCHQKDGKSPIIFSVGEGDVSQDGVTIGAQSFLVLEVTD